MLYYIVGAFGRASCLALIAVLLAVSGMKPGAWVAYGFLVLWTLYAFVSGIVAVPYNDIVGRSIPTKSRSRMLAWRFFGGGILALGVAGIIDRLLEMTPVLTAYTLIFALASALMFLSSIIFVTAGEPRTKPRSAAAPKKFVAFLRGGRTVLATDTRFRMFLYTQWLGGASLMALPFYIVAASRLGLGVGEVGILLGAQTAGSLISNYLWGQVGDRLGKLTLLQVVGLLRAIAPAGAIAVIAAADSISLLTMTTAFVALFFTLGALVNGTTIGYLGFLMEISPDDQRPAYSPYFNALASPAALLPLLGAVIFDQLSLALVFVISVIAALLQIVIYARFARLNEHRALCEC